jgi:hypothetical protein
MQKQGVQLLHPLKIGFKLVDLSLKCRNTSDFTALTLDSLHVSV